MSPWIRPRNSAVSYTEIGKEGCLVGTSCFVNNLNWTFLGGRSLTGTPFKSSEPMAKRPKSFLGNN